MNNRVSQPPGYTPAEPEVPLPANTLSDRNSHSPQDQASAHASIADLEPVTLTWTPPSGSALSLHSTVTMPSTLPLDQDAEPPFQPPAYEAARQPTQPITYTFSRLSSSSDTMLLLPPDTSQDTRPQYHISVGMNCFIPCSYITTVHRGSSETGQYVGDFEMGLSEDPGTVCIRGDERIISKVLKKTDGSHKNGRYEWDFSKQGISWQYTETTATDNTIRAICYLWPDTRITHFPERDAKVAAIFAPKTKLRKRAQPPPLSRLKVFPIGQQYLDHILLSLLIIERRRLTPYGRMETKSQWNA